MLIKKMIFWTSAVALVILLIVFAVIYFMPPGEVVEARYESYADVVKNNAIERGMVPDFLPKSATRIRAFRNLDLNITDVEFSYKEDFLSFLSSQTTSKLPEHYVLPNDSEIDLRSVHIIFIPKVSTLDQFSQGELVVDLAQKRALFYYDPHEQKH